MSLSPHTFSKVTYHLKRVTEYAQKYFKLFQWKRNSRILDIGSGPGHLLFEIEPLFPKDYSEILCTDMLGEMVNYLNSQKRDPRIKAIQMDIQTTSLPSDLKGRFDFVFSCNSVMYWANIRQSFSNISQLMNESGQLFFIWAKKGDVHDIYKVMNTIPKWAPYTREFKNWTNHFDNKNPTGTVKTEFERVGIEILKSETMKWPYVDEEKNNLTGSCLNKCCQRKHNLSLFRVSSVSECIQKIIELVERKYHTTPFHPNMASFSGMHPNNEVEKIWGTLNETLKVFTDFVTRKVS